MWSLSIVVVKKKVLLTYSPCSLPLCLLFAFEFDCPSILCCVVVPCHVSSRLVSSCLGVVLLALRTYLHGKVGTFHPFEKVSLHVLFIEILLRFYSFSFPLVHG